VSAPSDAEPVAQAPKRREFPVVTVVVPDNYRGEFWVESDGTRGESLAADSDEFIVTIPASGKLVLRSLGPLTKWHAMNHRFANGDPITESDEGESTVALLPPDAVRLWSYSEGTVHGTSGKLKRIPWFIGTYAELRAWKSWRLDFPDGADDDPRGSVRVRPR
jgi:hypothetical protein